MENEDKKEENIKRDKNGKIWTGKPRGGKRVGAGRKKRSDEQEMLRKLGPLEPMALQALQLAIGNGDSWAVTLFMKYFYGLPKVKIDHTTNGGNIQPIMINFLTEDMEVPEEEPNEIIDITYEEEEEEDNEEEDSENEDNN